MEEEILNDLGLTKNESKVYVSLLKIGSSTVTNIANESGIHRVNVYDSIKKLQEKNLVTKTGNQDKTTYQAAPPSFLTTILKEKEMKLRQIIPMLELCHQFSRKSVNVQVYEGYDFIRNMFIRFVEKGEPILDLGIPKFVLNNMGAHGMDGKFFQTEIHKRREKQKQWMYHIYSSDAQERIKFLNTLPFTEAKCLPKEFDQMVTTTICGDEFNIQVYSENGAKPIIISIRSKEVVDAFQKYFWLIWEKGVFP